jgi:hypothetical protein
MDELMALERIIRLGHNFAKEISLENEINITIVSS